MTRHWMRTLGSMLVVGLSVLCATPLLAQAPAAKKPAPAKTVEAGPVAPKPDKEVVLPGSADKAFEYCYNFYQEGEWSSALVGFQLFEKRFPFSLYIPDAINYQGWCWSNLTRFKEAASVFQRVLAFGTNSTLYGTAMLKQAECYRELKENDKAIELYQKFQVQFPKSDMLPQAMLGEAWVDFKAGKLDLAKGIINSVRSKYSNNAAVSLDALFLLGQVYTESKDFESANKVYRLITKQRSNPRATEALYLAAEALLNRGEALLKEEGKDAKETALKQAEGRKAFLDAIDLYKAVRSKNALIEAVQKEIEQLNASRGRLTAEVGAEVVKARAESLRQLLVQIKDRQDLRSLALFRVANCYQGLDMPEEASVVYEYLRDRYPDDKAAEQIYFGLIQTLTARRMMDRATKETENFKQKFPKSSILDSAVLMQAEREFAQEKYKYALASYEKAIAASKSAEVTELIEFRMAQCYFNMYDWQQPKDAVVEPAKLKEGLANLDKSRERFEAFTTKHPSAKARPDALFFVGLIRYEQAKRSDEPKVAKANIEAAILAYEEIHTKYTSYDKLNQIIFRLGYFYSSLGALEQDPAGKTVNTVSYDKAIASFQEFITKWPAAAEGAEALYQVGRNNISANRLDKVIEPYKALLEKYPDSDLAPYTAVELANIYGGLNKRDEMVEALRYYVKKYPLDPRVGEALYSIAAVLEADKKTDDALVAYRNVIDHALTNGALTDDGRKMAISAQLKVAALLEKRNAPKTVVADCEEVLAKFASDPAGARALVSAITSIYQKNRLFADGYAELEQLSQKYQVNPAVRQACIVSIIDLALGEKDLKRASAQAARLENDPDQDKITASGFLAIANVYLKQGKFAQAKGNFEKLMATSDKDPRITTLANYGLGASLLELKQYDEAKTALQKALSDTQNVPACDARLALAKVAEATGKIKDASDLFNTVMRECKGDPQYEASFRAASIYFNMKTDFQGVPLSDKQIKENKKLALPYYGRLLFYQGPMADEAAFRAAECHEAQGPEAYPLACSAFQGYVRQYPNGKFVEEAKTKIAKMCPSAK